MVIRQRLLTLLKLNVAVVKGPINALLSSFFSHFALVAPTPEGMQRINGKFIPADQGKGPLWGLSNIMC